tara:strand:- start:202 stop:438 length:237 start_codon:yes stop_codon:yes gene_type:complete
MARKKVTKKRARKKAGSSKVCMSCGNTHCGCKSYVVLKGALLLFLGVLLWAGVFSLELVVALLLILWGVKKISWGFHI